jgi:hypothetical protein
MVKYGFGLWLISQSLWPPLQSLNSIRVLSAMSSRHSSSWFYEFDVFGRRVLVGLSFSETIEFEKLDAKPPLNKNGRCHLPWEANPQSFPAGDARWLELYHKHLSAMESSDRLGR